MLLICYMKEQNPANVIADYDILDNQSRFRFEIY